MIKISRYNPNLANDIKCKKLIMPFDAYIAELQKLVDFFLYEDSIPALPGKNITDRMTLTARLNQVCAKQASAIARSIKSKVDKANKDKSKGKTLKKYQKEILSKYNNRTLSIDIKSINIELDSRFISIEPSTNTLCDYWIKITSFPKGSYLIPLRLTKHIKDLISRGFTMKLNSLRVNNDGTIGIYFHKESAIKNHGGTTGIDLGRNKIITTSNGDVETTHSTGKRVKYILDIINRSKVNSKRSKRLRAWLINQINYSLKNDIDWVNIQNLIIENLKDIKRDNAWGKRNQFWRVGFALRQIEQLCEENDVRLTRINAAYTSQMCSLCGVIDKKNRSQEHFLCIGCGNSMDADHNAARNIRNRGVNSLSTRKISCYV